MDRDGLALLITAFRTALTDGKSMFQAEFDKSIISMKGKDRSADTLRFIHVANIPEDVLASIRVVNEDILWSVSREDMEFAMDYFETAQKCGCFFPAEFMMATTPKNKKRIDDIYCKLIDG